MDFVSWGEIAGSKGRTFSTYFQVFLQSGYTHLTSVYKSPH